MHVTIESTLLSVSVHNLLRVVISKITMHHGQHVHGLHKFYFYCYCFENVSIDVSFCATRGHHTLS